MRDVRSVMHKGAIHVGPTESLVNAIEIMLEHGLGALPVLRADGTLTGVVSSTDLLWRSELDTGTVPEGFFTRFTHEDNARTFVHLYGRQVCDVMTRDPISISPDMPLNEAIEIMRHKSIHRLYVTEDSKLVGVLSGRDVMHVLREKLLEKKPALNDEQITQKLHDILSKAKWAADVTFKVENGTVIWEGAARDVTDLHAMRALAEDIPGVRAVEDRTFLLKPGVGFARPKDLLPDEWY
ncbi:CBS domain-containing protein [Aristophania vespae]|uniref:CBS domain-containing protein n=1 Tax=Aristophania vespae TaxID=2697033 RepID=A0A6P1NFK5_9PROT|nr:CBS domain-containing protein [Aristophania vespae]QHI95687.1 CBS domain-containing protein [Aristophania vespae]